jgi:hypothetical protein
MIARTGGILFAFAFTLACILGISFLIALDLLGEETLFKLWQRSANAAAPVQSLASLEEFREITLFSSLPVEGTPLNVQTGVKFNTIADLRANRQYERWCYVLARPEGGLPRKIDLADQVESSAPTFHDLSGYADAELAMTGLTRNALAAIARSHCRFAAPSWTAISFLQSLHNVVAQFNGAPR